MIKHFWTEYNLTRLFGLHFDPKVPASVEHEVVHGEEQMTVLVRIWHQMVLVDVKLQRKKTQQNSFQWKMLEKASKDTSDSTSD